MTDIKSRLVDGLRGQGIRLPNGHWLRLDDDNLELIADVLLSLPGIAIVELPKPDKKTPSYLNGSMAWGSETNLELAAWPSEGVITNAEGEELSPHECRKYAAALLAAAVQAQEEQP